MKIDEDLKVQMSVVDDIYPSGSKLDVALAKLGVYMAFIARNHRDLVEKHPVVCEEFFKDNEYKGMTPEQMRCFFRSCPNLRNQRLRLYLDDLWDYFIQNGAFDTATIRMIEQSRREKGELWLSKGLLNKHLSRLARSEQDAVFEKVKVHGKSRYITRFKGNIVNLRVPVNIKKAVASAPISNFQSDSGVSTKAFLFNRSISSIIKNGPLKQRQIDFDQELTLRIDRFAQEICDLYLMTVFPGKTNEEAMVELRDLQSQSADFKADEMMKVEIEKKRKQLLSPLPIIIIAPMGEMQLDTYTHHNS